MKLTDQGRKYLEQVRRELSVMTGRKETEIEIIEGEPYSTVRTKDFKLISRIENEKANDKL